MYFKNQTFFLILNCETDLRANNDQPTHRFFQSFECFWRIISCRKWNLSDYKYLQYNSLSCCEGYQKIWSLFYKDCEKYALFTLKFLSWPKTNWLKLSKFLKSASLEHVSKNRVFWDWFGLLFDGFIT